jgi:two-component system LytT family response regulator
MFESPMALSLEPSRAGASSDEPPEPPRTLRKAERLVVKSGGKLLFVPLSEIDWVEGSGNNVKIHAGVRVLTSRTTMGDLEERLDPERFVRIHRSAIVNIGRVREIAPLMAGASLVTLADGTRLTMSRGYRRALEELLEGAI